MEANNLISGTRDEVNLAELSGVSPEERQGVYCDDDGNPIKLTYDQLVQDFCDQHKDTMSAVSYTHLTLPTNREV